MYNNSKQGYLQLKADTNDIGCYEQLGRVAKQVKRDVKTKKPRFFPPSGLRKLCAAATPDGPPTGIINNIGIHCRISAGTDVDLVAKIIHQMGFFDARATSLQPRKFTAAISGSGIADQTFRQAASGLAESRGAGARLRTLVMNRPAPSQSTGAPYHYTVNINGNPVGCLRPDVGVPQFIDRFRALRRRRIVPRDASVHFDQSMHCVQVHCEIGRMMTALFITDQMPRVAAVINMCNQVGANKVKELFIQGCVEYVDSFEEEHSVVAMEPADVLKNPHIKYDYCAFTATSIFGLSAALIPSAHRNPGPRASYHSAGQTKAGLQESSFEDARFLAPTVVMSISNAQYVRFHDRLFCTVP